MDHCPPSTLTSENSPLGSDSMRRLVLPGVELYLGDCLEIAPSLQGVDAVISDPPYGMDWDTDSTRFSGGSVKRGVGREDWAEIHNDDAPFDPSPWLVWEKVVLFGANHFAARLPVGTTLVWIKKADHRFSALTEGAGARPR